MADADALTALLAVQSNLAGADRSLALDDATCHTKPRKQGEQGGIVKRETPIRACKVALYCPKCEKGVRVGFKVEDGKKTRICRKCGAEI